MPATDDTEHNILAYIANIIIHFKGIYSLPLLILLFRFFNILSDWWLSLIKYILFILHRIYLDVTTLQNCELYRFPLDTTRPSFLFILPSWIIGVYDIVIAVAKTIKPTIRILQVIPVHFQVSGVVEPIKIATAKIAIAINIKMLPTRIAA